MITLNFFNKKPVNKKQVSKFSKIKKLEVQMMIFKKLAKKLSSAEIHKYLRN